MQARPAPRHRRSTPTERTREIGKEARDGRVDASDPAEIHDDGIGGTLGG